MPREVTKPPLKADPLRVPGQSLSGQLIDHTLDQVLLPYVMAAMLVVLAAVEWTRYLTNSSPSPWLFTSVAVVAVGWAAIKMRRGFERQRAIRLGRDGERAVAQYLERFIAKGFKVFHDVPNGDANIDHVLVGPKGIYTIETKTLSKPTRGECVISVEDGAVRANGRIIERNALVQAKAQARWLYNFFAESEFKAFVQPVVVFPGWWVEDFDMRSTGVWVLEPKQLEGFLENQRELLTTDQVKAMASALSSFIRQRYNA